jgi:hypothetical protein
MDVSKTEVTRGQTETYRTFEDGTDALNSERGHETLEVVNLEQDRAPQIRRKANN